MGTATKLIHWGYSVWWAGALTAQIVFQICYDRCQNRIGVFFKLAFPDDNDVPTQIFKFFLLAPIPLNSFGEFIHPEFDSGLGSCRFFTPRVTMPKASVYK